MALFIFSPGQVLFCSLRLTLRSLTSGAFFAAGALRFLGLTGGSFVSGSGAAPPSGSRSAFTSFASEVGPTDAPPLSNGGPSSQDLGLGLVSVSYTHLTLPTILLV